MEGAEILAVGHRNGRVPNLLQRTSTVQTAAMHKGWLCFRTRLLDHGCCNVAPTR